MNTKLFLRMMGICVMLVFVLGVGSIQSTTAQEDDPIIEYFFPLFTHHTDPYYAFGLDGGTVVAMAVDPGNSETVYAGTWGNGVFRSVDGGKNWEQKSSGLESAYIYALAIDPSNSNNILVSAYEHEVNRSMDGGDTWEATSGMPPGSVAYSIDYRPGTPNIVYAAIRKPTEVVGGVTYWPGGVYKSTDGGASWLSFSNGLPIDYVYDLAIDPRYPDVMYTAMHREGVYKTTNGGNNWYPKLSGLGEAKDIRGVDVHPTNSHVYIAHWDSEGLSYSDNGGDRWTRVNWTDNAQLYVWKVHVDPNHPSSVYLTTSTGYYRCENPSASSACQLVAHGGKFAWDLALDKNGPVNSAGLTARLFAALQHFGIHKSTSSGVSFDPIYRGLRANIVTDVGINPANPNIQFVSANERGLYKTVDGGLNWSPLHHIIPSRFINEIAFRPGEPNVVYAGTQSDGLWISYDSGINWVAGGAGLGRSAEEAMGGENESEPLADQGIYDWMDPVDYENMIAPFQNIAETRGSSYYRITALDFAPGNPLGMFMGTDGAGVKYSNNGGLNWAGTSLSSGTVNDVAVDPSSTYPFLVSMNNSGFRVSNDRVNWTNRNTGLSGSGNVLAIAVSPSGYYLVGTDNGIYKSTNQGGSWSRISYPNARVTDIEIDPSNADIAWATTSVGLFRSGDAGDSWTYYPLLDWVNPNMLTISPISGSNDYYIGMNGGDIYRLVSP